MDLRKLETVTDFFVICSGHVEPHVRAIADHILETMAQRGIRSYHREGYHGSRWILLDYLDVVVHIFQPAWRDYYRLEDLWGDARIRVLDEAYLRRKERRAAGEPRRGTTKRVGAAAKTKVVRGKRKGARKP
ncbi:MAG: ribosome silencing factor [Calditrichaeota bacterium]|nr:ribosome silencing factor [Calditrichota bacterium]